MVIYSIKRIRHFNDSNQVSRGDDIKYLLSFVVVLVINFISTQDSLYIFICIFNKFSGKSL